MLYGLLLALFILVAILMVFVILIQSGKGGGLAGIAGGNLGTVFGGRGSAPFLTKATAVLAAVFMILALALGMMTKGVADQSTLMQRERERRAASPARTLPQVEIPSQSSTPTGR